MPITVFNNRLRNQFNGNQSVTIWQLRTHKSDIDQLISNVIKPVDPYLNKESIDNRIRNLGRIFQYCETDGLFCYYIRPKLGNLISNIHSVDDQSMEYLWKISKSILSASQDKKSVSLIISNQIAPLLIGFRNLSTSRLSLMDCSSFFLYCSVYFN